jgi:bifunctional DNA-binding transcriptional regulator/antitoxin component of YhaV-PrlF toxin-antitoxin module
MMKRSELKPGDKVEVYRNLHKDCFSVRKKGKVVGYLYDSGMHHRNVELYLTDATFVIQPAGRKKVLKEQRKNVHAFVRGIVTNTGGLHRESIIRRCIKKVTYDPYTMKTFQDMEGNIVIEAKEVFISHGVVHI